MPRTGSLPKVLLLVETSLEYGRQNLEGIGRYVREHGPWSMFFEQHGLLDRAPRFLKEWRGQGIITRTATLAIERWIARQGIPAVELLGFRPDMPAKIHADNALAARLAVRHLVDCGLRHLGFFAFGEAWWVDLYRTGFEAELAERKLDAHVFQPPGNRLLLPEWQESQRRRAMAWLRGLPQPVGIFAPSHGEGATLLDLCRRADLAVPEQVAVVSADDDPTICNVTTPPLSSVDLNPGRIGYEAAALLDRMMAGGPAPPATLWIPPLGVVVRQSSDILAIEDADTAQAMRFIRENACRGIDVTDVAAAIGLSRRALEQRFRRYLGRAPKAEILRIRLDAAKRLLAQSNMSIELIAKRTGFATFKHFGGIFRRTTGQTPRAFRAANRLGLVGCPGMDYPP